jgi:hypothetical protein
MSDKVVQQEETKIVNETHTTDLAPAKRIP